MKIIYLTTGPYTKQLKSDLFIDIVSEKYDVLNRTGHSVLYKSL